MNRRVWLYQVTSAAVAGGFSGFFGSSELPAGHCDVSSKRLTAEISETLVRVTQALDRILQKPAGPSDGIPSGQRVRVAREIVHTAASLAAGGAIVPPALLQTCCWKVEQICSESGICESEPEGIADLKAEVQHLNGLLVVTLTAGASEESRLWPLA